MADEIDATNDRVESETALLVADVARRAAFIPVGRAGECFFCGEEFSRVIEVVYHDETVESCGRCRDRRGL